MHSFNPQKDIPNLAGKVFLVTGGNSGLGEATIAAIAQHNPAKIYLGARSVAKAKEAITRIRAASPEAASANIEILELDLASLKSVEAAASRLNSSTDRLDVLQLSGGIAMPPHDTTKDGYEVQLGVNYMGHAMLTQLLAPKLLATAKLPGADVRIVSISSVAHKVFAPKAGILFDELKTDMSGHSGRELYGQSMLAKALFTHELAKRYPQITSSSLHPGTVKSSVWGGDKDVNWLVNKLLVKPLVALTGVSVEEGVKTQLWCSFSKDVQSGNYYEPVGKVGQEGKLTRDDVLSERLWKWTEEELRVSGAAGWPAS
ncbi:hypothetical protein ACHAQA_004407 [Verticillium albo-atrum]